MREVEDRRERLPVLGASKGEHRGLAAAAPGARVHPGDAHALGAKALADAPRFVAPRIGQVALRRAIVQPVAGRIAQASITGRYTLNPAVKV